MPGRGNRKCKGPVAEESKSKIQVIERRPASLGHVRQGEVAEVSWNQVILALLARPRMTDLVLKAMRSHYNF